MENLFQVMLIFGLLFFVLFGFLGNNSIESENNLNLQKFFLVMTISFLIFAIIGFIGLTFLHFFP